MRKRANIYLLFYRKSYKSLSGTHTHTQFRCCGYNGIHDYKKNKQMGFPWSCYDPIDTKVFNTGCMHVFVKSIEMNMIRVAVVAVASALIQVCGCSCSSHSSPPSRV